MKQYLTKINKILLINIAILLIFIPFYFLLYIPFFVRNYSWVTELLLPTAFIILPIFAGYYGIENGTKKISFIKGLLSVLGLVIAMMIFFIIFTFEGVSTCNHGGAAFGSCERTGYRMYFTIPLFYLISSFIFLFFMLLLSLLGQIIKIKNK